MSENAFEMHEVTAAYGFKRPALHALSLALPRGSSLGLLGVNGAGKTTAIRTLIGILRPKKGKVLILGNKPGRPDTLRRLGFAPEDGLPPDYLTVKEYLNFIGSFRQVEKNAWQESAEWFELSVKKKVSDLSKGMRRRLVLAQALLGNPELLILDEPLNGLDPMMIIRLRERLGEYLAKGGTLLFSSHILGEIEKLCTDVAIVSHGKLICFERAKTLAETFGSIEAAFRAKAMAGLQ